MSQEQVHFNQIQTSLIGFIKQFLGIFSVLFIPNNNLSLIYYPEGILIFLISFWNNIL